MINLTSKNGIVTGGMGGIGYSTCIQLLQNGLSKLAIVDVQCNEELLGELTSNFKNHDIIYHKVNVADRNQIEHAYKDIKQSFKQIHILINCAGVLNDNDVSLTLDVNVGGVINSSLIGLSLMDTQNGGEGGVIINISSLVALMSLPTVPVYTASKYAVIGFTRSLGNELFLQKCGVKCMAICPGATDTTILNDISAGVLYPFLLEFYNAVLPTMFLQKTETVGKCVIEVLNNGKNGSIWISDSNKNREFEPNELTMDNL